MKPYTFPELALDPRKESENSKEARADYELINSVALNSDQVKRNLQTN